MISTTVLLVGLLVAALAAFFLLRKRGNDQTALPPQRNRPQPAPRVPQQPAAPASPAPARPAEPVAPVSVAPAPAVVQPVSAVSGAAHPLDEAESLIGSNQLPQAVALLQQVPASDPRHVDSQLRLLRLYGSQQDAQQFDSQLSRIEALGKPEATRQALSLFDEYFGAPAAPADLDQPLEFTSSKPAAPEPAALDFPVSRNSGTTLDKGMDFAPVSQPDTPASNEFTLDDLERDLAQEDRLSSASATSPAAIPLAATSLDMGQSAVVPPDSVVTIRPTDAVPAASAATQTQSVDLQFDLDESFSVETDANRDKGAGLQQLAGDLADQDFSLSSGVTPVAGRDVADPASVAFRSEMQPGTGSADSSALQQLKQEFPFVEQLDEYQTRLELAESYLELGEYKGARELLDEVVVAGNLEQQGKARQLLAQTAQ